MFRIALAAAALAGLSPAQADPSPPPRPRISIEVPLDDPGARELRLYPVRERLDAILDLHAGVDVRSADARREEERELLRRLRDAIRIFVQPAFEDGEEVQALGFEHLAVVGRPEQHAWTEAFLERQSTLAQRIATVQLELLKIAPAAFAKLEFGAEPLVLDPKGAAALRLALAADGSGVVDTLQAPRISTLALQSAQASALNNTSYVRDYEVIRLDDGSSIADPVIDVVRDGLVLDGWFVALDEGHLGLCWSVTAMDLQRPIPKFQTQLGAGNPVSIQLPDVAVARFDAEVVLAPGSLAVFPGPSLRDERLVLLLSVAEFGKAGERPRRSGPELLLKVGDETAARKR
jgi:hypothetical protein